MDRRGDLEIAKYMRPGALQFHAEAQMRRAIRDIWAIPESEDPAFALVPIDDEPPLSTATAIHMLRERAERRQALKPIPVVAAVALAPFAWIIERRRRVGGL